MVNRNRMFCLGVCLIGFTSPDGVRADSLEQAFAECRQEADGNQAIRGCTRLIESDSGRLQENGRYFAHFQRGLAYFMTHDFGRAAADFSAAIALKPDDFAAYRNRAMAKQKMRRITGAIVDYRKALEFNPNDQESRKALEMIYMSPSNAPQVAEVFEREGARLFEADKFHRAIAAFDEVIKRDPDAAYSLTMRGWAYLRTGRPQMGLVDVNLAIQVAPAQARSYDVRGLIKEALGLKQDAIADFRRAMELDPQLGSARDNLNRLNDRPG